MQQTFLSTFILYAQSILPWFAAGIIIAYIVEKNFRPAVIKKYFGSANLKKLFVAQILGMLSPLSIMSFLPIANEFIHSGAHPGVIFSFFIAERAYDLQSFFIIASLFGIKFATLNALAILLSLLISAYTIRNEQVKFRFHSENEHHSFWFRQSKLIVIVILGIIVGALLRTLIPASFVQSATGTTIGGIAGGSILGFLLYFGPIMGNYPVAKAFADLGMSSSGVFAFLTISPVVNIVVILLFSGAVGFKNTYKAFLAYGVSALILTILFSPFL
jgi:uncharacterized membrane protein YraQ (UPF0718 family)